jgi:large repetitive protein
LEEEMTIKLKKALQLIAIILIGIFMVATVVGFARNSSQSVLASGPIPPPEGYPKLSLSTKVVTPTLANTDGAILTYNLEILNTGAYTASDVSLADVIPANTVYNGDAWSSAPPTPVITDGVLTWENGTVGFDSSVVITFSVTVTPGYVGIISNTAVISAPMITEPVSVLAETRITDTPMFEIVKTSAPDLPGKNKPFTYELVVTNQGQAAVATPITVTDFVPADTTFLGVGPDGSYNPVDNVVTWHRTVDLGFGETSAFTFSVNVGDVPSGTVIDNDSYLVVSPEGISAGMPYSTTVIDPIFILSKSVFPDPPGSNTEMTYTLTVLNLGSKATDLVITDTVPSELEYVRGGDDFTDGVVTWHLPSLDTRESAQVTFTVYIGDIADIIVLNGDYGVCSAEGVCASGIPVSSLIVGPIFEATAILDPLAHKPGGGNAPVTPTLTIENLGPGNALDATALVTFGRLSISMSDMAVIPPVGKLVKGPPCDVAFPCTNFVWMGDVSVGEIITFTTLEGQSTIGGEEGTHYTATVVITDELSGYVTEPITGTAIGHVTHYANLIPTKTAPPEIGPGQTMTYTIQVLDSGLSTEEDPTPTLTETVPASVTLLSISDGGSSDIIDGNTVITWELPPMGPGDILLRSFAVEVDPDLVSGTLIVNDDYRTSWYESELPGTLSNLGEPVTTTVGEVGLIDSFKTVDPTWALPGTGTVLTYVVHVVNSGPVDLSGVQVSDIFPWENTTYQRDAVASAGSLISDIVSLEWTGDIAPYSEQLITFTTVVDDFFEGVLTNTATITHTSLKQDVVVTAVAYITDKPVLQISKKATPSPVSVGNPLLYQLQVTNLGQQATMLVVTDTIPVNTAYILGSASSGGQLVGDTLQWNLPVLNPGQTLKFTFQVMVTGGKEIVNGSYAVRCDEGVFAYGAPVVTPVLFPVNMVHLPLTFRY